MTSRNVCDTGAFKKALRKLRVVSHTLCPTLRRTNVHISFSLSALTGVGVAVTTLPFEP